jgi:DNA-binding NtrC family response regulator
MNLSESPAIAPSPKPAVLLVDDEKPLLDVFAAALEPFFSVTQAFSTRDADAALRAGNFKVVVSDHLMPGGNGTDFLIKVRQEFPQVQRVLVSGYLKPEVLLRSAQEAALFRFLMKPVAIDELVRAVQEAARAHDLAVSAA